MRVAEIHFLAAVDQLNDWVEIHFAIFSRKISTALLLVSLVRVRCKLDSGKYDVVNEDERVHSTSVSSC